MTPTPCNPCLLNRTKGRTSLQALTLLGLALWLLPSLAPAFGQEGEVELLDPFEGAPDRKSEEAHEEPAGYLLPAEIHWCEGHVSLPEGTPADELIQVYGWTHQWPEPGGKFPVDAEPDGSFRIPFPAGTTQGYVTFEGKYVIAERQTLTWHPGLGEPLEFKAALAASWTIKVENPDGEPRRRTGRRGPGFPNQNARHQRALPGLETKHTRPL